MIAFAGNSLLCRMALSARFTIDAGGWNRLGTLFNTGKGVMNPIQTTAGNFLRTVPFALGLSLFTQTNIALDLEGIGYAISSGAIASGMGYAIWYHALSGLITTQAATALLSVPVLAAIAAIP